MVKVLNCSPTLIISYKMYGCVFPPLNHCTFSFRSLVCQVRTTVQLSRKSWRTSAKLRRSWRNRERKGRKRFGVVGDFQSALTLSAEVTEVIHGTRSWLVEPWGTLLYIFGAMNYISHDFNVSNQRLTARIVPVQTVVLEYFKRFQLKPF